MSQAYCQQFRVPNDPSEIARLRKELGEALARHRYPEAAAFAVRLAFEEGISNAFRHGHRDLSPSTPVRVRLEVDDREAVIEIEDAGPGFDPGAVPDPTLPENLEKPGGRGLMLMQAYMSEVSYNERGNCVRMVFRRDVGQKPGP